MTDQVHRQTVQWQTVGDRSSTEIDESISKIYKIKLDQLQSERYRSITEVDWSMTNWVRQTKYRDRWINYKLREIHDLQR